MAPRHFRPQSNTRVGSLVKGAGGVSPAGAALERAAKPTVDAAKPGRGIARVEAVVTNMLYYLHGRAWARIPVGCFRARAA